MEMLPSEFSVWQHLLETRVGIVIDIKRRLFLQTHLTTRMRALGIDDYADYYRYVTRGAAGVREWADLLNHLTTQFTQFFRHAPSFDVLEAYLSQRIQAESNNALSLWSVGCSSGEEAYSMAITASEVFRRADLPEHYGVFGSDISTHALDHARLGLYAFEKVKHLDVSLLDRYFLNHADGKFSVVPSLKARLCCTRLNVLELGKAPISGMDVIFCQNVLIYFRRWLRKDILNQLVNKLSPGGLLVVGVGETSGWSHPELIPLADERVLAFTRRVA
jgi:type IV pilus assembly protein PilK